MQAMLSSIEAAERAVAAPAQPALPPAPKHVSRSLVVAPSLAASRRAGALACRPAASELQVAKVGEEEGIRWRPPRAAGAFSNLFVAAESSGPTAGSSPCRPQVAERKFVAGLARRPQTDFANRPSDAARRPADAASRPAAHVSTSVGDAVSDADFCKGMRGGFLSASSAKPGESDRCKSIGIALWPSDQVRHHCAKCSVGIANKPLRCSRCQTVFYCSRQCQREDWDSHKLFCGKLDSGVDTDAVVGIDACTRAGVGQPLGHYDDRSTQTVSRKNQFADEDRDRPAQTRDAGKSQFVDRDRDRPIQTQYSGRSQLVDQNADSLARTGDMGKSKFVERVGDSHAQTQDTGKSQFIGSDGGRLAQTRDTGMSNAVAPFHCAEPPEEFWCCACNEKLVGELMCCMRCQAAYYCSRICQRRDWDNHKQVCGKKLGAAVQPPKISVASSAVPPTQGEPVPTVESNKGLGSGELASPSLEDFLAMLDQEDALDAACGETR